jgi:hypothetical protein
MSSAAKGPLWNFEKFQSAIAQAYNAEVAERAIKSAQSIERRKLHARYHYSEVHLLLANQLIDADSGTVLVEHILPNASPDYDENVERRHKAEAHLLAMVQALHSMEDNLAHVIYYAMNFDGDPKLKMKEHAIDFASVRKALSAGTLLDLVVAMSDEKDLIHLRGLVNVSKHRSIVRAGITVSNTDGKHGLTFEGFEYKGQPYSPRWATDFVASAFDLLQEHVLAISNQLNRQLEA